MAFLQVSLVYIVFLLLWHYIFSSVCLSPIIVLPGGGVSPDGNIPKHTELRLQEAVKIYTKYKNLKPIIIPLSGGTPHKPSPVDSLGFPIWEATAAATRLIQLGIPADSILEESFSLDTVGNVKLFTLLNTFNNVSNL